MSGWRRMLVAASVVLAGTLGPTHIASASVPPSTPPVTNDFMDLERDVTQCISSMPKPGCGRKPVDSGDRGGALQYAVFGALMLGMAAIGTRIVFAVRARDRAVPSDD